MFLTSRNVKNNIEEISTDNSNVDDSYSEDSNIELEWHSQ